jgi:hypothetical protein
MEALVPREIGAASQANVRSTTSAEVTGIAVPLASVRSALAAVRRGE